ncbi:MAG: glycosyltransferase family 2 protein [Ignavibacteria bacterium]|nr:glycosyltransferase family 2 protein [Ignavibacteria bacterium]
MPKISIITPLYNGEKTLYETAESVLSQDYKDWEWILFDDGSKDSTKEIAKKLSDEYSDKIFFHTHEGNSNHGTAFTRNRAVDISKSEIISFIDQDDIWYENRLSHQIKLFENKTDCAMIWGPALYWYINRTFKQPVGLRGNGLKSRKYDPPDFVEIFLSDLRGTPLPSASLVRRKEFENVGGFEESIKGSEDIVLWLKLAERFSIYYDDVILIKYRKHQDSTLRIASSSGKMNVWNLVFYKWVIDFLKRTSAKQSILDENEFAYYKTLKKISGRKNYINSRKDLYNGLKSYPELKKKYSKDFLLDLILPFDTASRISAKLRFDLFRRKEIENKNNS